MFISTNVKKIYEIKLNKKFQRKIVNIFFPIIFLFSICFGF